MAKELLFNTGWGIDLPKSYWKISNINIDTINQQIRVNLMAYKDKAAADTDKNPIDSKSYDFKGSAFLGWYNQVIANKNLNSFEWAYNSLDDVRDTVRTRVVHDVVIEKDKDGNDVEVVKERTEEVIESFFKDALDV